ncbi:hypothetical protein PanWU01x14_134350 [Parasponia andersonii]|uniref:Uncharacterized protein n=1 Tax=Parasponia andersonii TaxID=3476 RepID=A0A2P5CPM0_PARAD|nr:hypothetical protein PanWU01x14_134350 [Parasponia andersonii]
MDMNQSMNFIPSSSSSDPQLPNMMMPLGDSFILPEYYQQSMMSAKQDAKEARRSHIKKVQKQNMEIFWNQQLLDMQNIPDL